MDMSVYSRSPGYFYALGGLFDLFVAPHPDPKDVQDTDSLGFHQGKQIVGLFIIEIILKCFLADAKPNVKFKGKYDNHKLAFLFKELPEEYKISIEQEYQKIISGHNVNLQFCRIEGFLKSLGDEPLTRTRYFMEPDKDGCVHVGWPIYDTYNVVCALMLSFPDWDEDWVPKPFPYYISSQERQRLGGVYPHCMHDIKLVDTI